MEQAACRGDKNPAYLQDLQIYHVHEDLRERNQHLIDAAKANCDRCEVSESCLEFILNANYDPGGVYAGTNGEQRDVMRKRLRNRRQKATIL